MGDLIQRFETISQTAARRIVVTEDGALKEEKLSRWDRFRNATIGPSKQDREINKLAHETFLRAIGRASDLETQMRAYDLLTPMVEAGKPLSARTVQHVLEQLHLTESDLYLRNRAKAQRYLESGVARKVYDDLDRVDRDFREVYSFDDFVQSVRDKFIENDNAGPRFLTEADFRTRLDAWRSDYFRQSNSNAVARLARAAQKRHAGVDDIQRPSFLKDVARLASQNPNFDKRPLSEHELMAYPQAKIDEIFRFLRSHNSGVAEDFATRYQDGDYQDKTTFTPLKDLLKGSLDPLDPRYGALANDQKLFNYPKLGREEYHQVQESVQRAIVEAAVSQGKALDPKRDAKLVVETAQQRLNAYFGRRPGALRRQVPKLMEHVEGDLREPGTVPPFDQIRSKLAGFAFRTKELSKNSALADRLRSGEDVVHPRLARAEQSDRRGIFETPQGKKRKEIEEIDDIRFGKVYADGEEDGAQKARRTQWTEVMKVVRDLEGHVDVLGETTEDIDTKRARLQKDKATLKAVADSTASDLQWQDNEIFKSLEAEVDRQLDELDNPSPKADEEQVEPFKPVPRSTLPAELRKALDEFRSPDAGRVTVQRASQEDLSTEVTEEEISRLLVAGRVSRDFVPDDDEESKPVAARSVYAANLAGAPAYPRLAKFTFQTSESHWTTPDRIFSGLRSHLLANFGIELSDAEFDALRDTPDLVVRYNVSTTGYDRTFREGLKFRLRYEKETTDTDLRHARERLDALNQRLAKHPKGEEPIVRALRDDIQANLVEIDQALKAGASAGPAAQPSQNDDGEKKKKRVRFS